METTDALAALRQIDLPEGRRRHLCALAATAGTDAERERIVNQAREESYRNRAETEASLKAEMASRRAWAARNPEGPSERPTEPPRVAPRPVVHPVVVTYGPITKTAKVRPERRPLFKKKAAPVPVVEPSPEPVVEPVAEKPVKHGLSQYKAGCRCDVCKLAKRESRKPKGKRRARGEVAPCGTTTAYQRGCRCQECRDAKAAHARKRYAEKRAKGETS